MGNSTGRLTAGALAQLAAQKILDLDGADPSITPELLSIARNVTAAPAPPAASPAGSNRSADQMVDNPGSSLSGSAGRVGVDSVLDNFVAPAVEQLDRVEALTSFGLRFADLGRGLVGVGLGVAWSDTDYAVLSVAGGLEGVLNLTAGVLKGITQDRLAVLTSATA